MSKEFYGKLDDTLYLLSCCSRALDEHPVKEDTLAMDAILSLTEVLYDEIKDIIAPVVKDSHDNSY